MNNSQTHTFRRSGLTMDTLTMDDISFLFDVHSTVVDSAMEKFEASHDEQNPSSSTNNHGDTLMFPCINANVVTFD